MNRDFLKKTLFPLMLLAGGLSALLFSSCANSGTKTASNLSPSNPAYYNPDSREFESRWPFGPGGYR
jgi:hypothetical protein